MDILRQHLIALQQIIQQSGEQLEGNCFYYHQSLQLAPELHAKQRNLLKVSMALPNSPAIMEIGFNAGHSILLFLIKQPTAHYTIFDICEHSYVRPCFEYLKNAFPQAQLELIEGDSCETVSNYNSQQFDMVHVDGGHLEYIAASDMANAVRLCKQGGYIILDDTNDPLIAAIGKSYEERNATILAAQFEQTALYEHTVYQKL